MRNHQLHTGGSFPYFLFPWSLILNKRWAFITTGSEHLGHNRFMCTVVWLSSSLPYLLFTEPWLSSDSPPSPHHHLPEILLASINFSALEVTKEKEASVHRGWKKGINLYRGGKKKSKMKNNKFLLCELKPMRFQIFSGKREIRGIAGGISRESLKLFLWFNLLRRNLKPSSHLKIIIPLLTVYFFPLFGRTLNLCASLKAIELDC